jgi:hypothetical protein
VRCRRKLETEARLLSFRRAGSAIRNAYGGAGALACSRERSPEYPTIEYAGGRLRRELALAQHFLLKGDRQRLEIDTTKRTLSSNNSLGAPRKAQ